MQNMRMLVLSLLECPVCCRKIPGAGSRLPDTYSSSYGLAHTQFLWLCSPIPAKGARLGTKFPSWVIAILDLEIHPF